MSVFKKIFMWMSDTGRVFRNEMNIFLHDIGVLLFFFALPLMYPVIYTLIYNPETVRKMPVAVVDESRSAESLGIAGYSHLCLLQRPAGSTRTDV